ncbi:unnamed protein product [Polarella glacialis]|uniref:Hexosyltransferase n=1 Tax=Polarella glacialis TaxID=89957 RepID=A0A813K596_POLGL|nr:unnamed protein product [Polarella glacialis]
MWPAPRSHIALVLSLLPLVSMMLQLSSVKTDGRVPPAAHSKSMIDIVTAAGLNWQDAAKTMVASVLLTAKDPSRLRFHIVVDAADSEGWSTFWQLMPNSSTRLLPGGALLVVHSMKIIDLQPSKYSPYRDISGHEANEQKRHTNGFNYVRFFIQDYVPVNSTVAFWLDSDMVIQKDIALLADSFMAQADAALGYVRRPDGCEYPILEAVFDPELRRKMHLMGLENRSMHNAGVIAVNMTQWRNGGLGDAALRLISENAVSEEAMYAGGSQVPLELAALLSNHSIVEHDSIWNCLHNACVHDPAMEACSIVHFIGPMKPWLPDSGPQTLWESAQLRAMIFLPTGIGAV